ncbi:MAG: ferredoxin [bacterium]
MEQGECWGRTSGEDGQTEACRLCVETCPRVFEKPEVDRGARAKTVYRVGMELTGETRSKARQAAWECPADAIRWRGSEGEPD